MALIRLLAGKTQYIRFFGYFLIIASAVFALWLSWYRWLNPQIDFTPDLYVAWRIMEGDLPVREIFRGFGPLSDYWNALVFYIFRPTLDTIIAVNLAIYSVIIILVFLLLRKAFGFIPTVLASVLGILIFGFSDYNGWGNYNYAAPYSHAATHGMLLLVLGLWVVARRIPKNPLKYGWLEGLIFGLICLTKIEFIFTGVVLMGMQGLRYLLTKGWMDLLRYVVQAAGACLAVLLLTWLILRVSYPELTAGEVSITAWSAFWIFQTDLAKSTFQEIAMGTDDWPTHLLVSIKVIFGAGLSLVALAGLVRLTTIYVPRRFQSWILLVFLLLTLWASCYVTWTGLARIFLPTLTVLTVYVIYKVHKTYVSGREKEGLLFISQKEWIMIVLAVVGGAMLARMPLFTRFYHYGFYQAMLAGVVTLAFIFAYLPKLAGKKKYARVVVFGCLCVMATIGVGRVLKLSNFYYRNKNTLVGEGANSFYVVDPSFNPTGLGLWRATEYLKKRTPENDQLLVVPEGIMVNFWLKRKNPIHVTGLNPASTKEIREDVMERLKVNPPEEVMIVSRVNMKEFGVPHFGYDEKSWKCIIDWVEQDYVELGRIGKTPYEPLQFGTIIYKSKKSVIEMQQRAALQRQLQGEQAAQQTQP